MRFGQKGADPRLDQIVAALADVVEADRALRVDQIDVRPVVVRVRAPRRHLVVEGDRPRQVVAPDRVSYVRRDLLERELGGVNADDLEPGRVIPAVQGAQRRECSDAVDARVGPEIDEHDFPAQRSDGERR